MNLKFWAPRGAATKPYFVTPRILTEAQQSRADLERLLTLADIHDEHPVWKTLVSYVDEHARNEQEAALAPNLSNDIRQYNAGRAAGALDFAVALRELRQHAQMEARKRQLED